MGWEILQYQASLITRMALTDPLNESLPSPRLHATRRRSRQSPSSRLTSLQPQTTTSVPEQSSQDSMTEPQDSHMTEPTTPESVPDTTSSQLQSSTSSEPPDILPEPPDPSTSSTSLRYSLPPPPSFDYTSHVQPHLPPSFPLQRPNLASEYHSSSYLSTTVADDG